MSREGRNGVNDRRQGGYGQTWISKRTSGRRERRKGRERTEGVVGRSGSLRQKVTCDFRTGRCLAGEHDKSNEWGGEFPGGGKTGSEENKQSKGSYLEVT